MQKNKERTTVVNIYNILESLRAIDKKTGCLT